MAGESCGHHAGVANGTKFDGQCCTGHLCAYPPPPWGDKGVMGKCVEIGKINISTLSVFFEFK